jgi:ArsR family transcriptional regulator
MSFKPTLKKLKALSDRTRLRAFMLLLGFDEICSCFFADFFKFSAPTISRHLSLLADAGFIKGRKEGRWVYFSLNRKSKDLENWIGLLEKSIMQKELIADRKKMQKILESGCGNVANCKKGSKRK